MALKSKLPERYPEILAMYARGHANSRDILKTDFGHWPPNDLDIVHAPSFDVEFKSIYQTPTGLRRLIPTFKSTLISMGLFGSHPITASLFFGVSYINRIMALRGFVNTKDPKIHLNDLYRVFSGSLSGRRMVSHVLMHEFKHVVQIRDKQESMTSSIDNNRLNIKSMLNKGISAHKKYLAEECEIQARMHTVMIGAYHQFERMPTNYPQLIAALHSQGVKIPKHVVKKLQETPQGREAFELFSADEEFLERYSDKTSVNGLNDVLKSVQPLKESIFCKKVLGFIYGDMLELYGDRLGHKRMGHTHNIQLREVFYKSAGNYSKVKAELQGQDIVDKSEIDEMDSHLSTAMDVIKKMPKEDAVDLGKDILKSVPYFEFNKFALVSFKRDDIGEKAITKIWGRQDLTLDDRAQIKQAAMRHQPSYSRTNNFIDTSDPKGNFRELKMEMVQ